MMGAEPIEVDTIDAAHRPHKAKFWFDPKTKTAVIEAAQVNGLALLPPGKYHPFDLDTFGLGKVFNAADSAGAEHAIVGIGGSATNDGGFGMARALGWSFNDERGASLRRWTELNDLWSLSPPDKSLKIKVTVAVDVQNPLLGPNGCSRIYGPQKGLREEDMPKAEACLATLADVTKARRDHDYANDPGAGAAGGLGFGLRAFLNGRFVPGFDIFSETARLPERIKTADLVISGEGCIDEQSLMGKGVGALYHLCRTAHVRFIGLAGYLSRGMSEEFPFDRNVALYSIVSRLATPEQSKAEPAKYLRLLASEAAKNVGSV
jgi:glycerate kinase